ncbi:MAG: CPBP family intramembrane metalloprotease [Anaerolineaceae bacterium]|nr:CPBP family intramembrane metalloprotease [Anaerolineaceae bacterium]
MWHRLHPGQKALLEVGILFLPAVPAYLWMWPNVTGPAADIANVVVYLYVLAGALFIGLRRWNWDQLGINRRGIWLSLAYGGVFILARLLILLGVQWPGQRPEFTFLEILGKISFYIGLVGLVEEFLHRGLIYRALLDWRGERWAIWGSSFAFVLWHVFGHGVLIGATMLFFGLIFALIRKFAGGIVGLILVHGLIDLEAIFLVNVSNQELTSSRFELSSPALILAGLGFLIFLPFALWKLHPYLARRFRQAAQGNS